MEAVGRVTRLMDRRPVRRAADQALMTPTYLRQLEMAGTPITTPPIDTREDIGHADPWCDHPHTEADEPADAITAPIAVAALQERLRNAPDEPAACDLPTSPSRADRAAAVPIGLP